MPTNFCSFRRSGARPPASSPSLLDSWEEGVGSHRPTSKNGETLPTCVALFGCGIHDSTRRTLNDRLSQTAIAAICQFARKDLGKAPTGVLLRVSDAGISLRVAQGSPGVRLSSGQRTGPGLRACIWKNCHTSTSTPEATSPQPAPRAGRYCGGVNDCNWHSPQRSC